MPLAASSRVRSSDAEAMNWKPSGAGEKGGSGGIGGIRGGGNAGGGGGDIGGVIGGDGGDIATVKVADPEAPVASSRDCPYPCHTALSQPSPYESVISRRHSDPSAILMHCENGAPPDKRLPSRQESVHPTSDPYKPAVTWMLSCRSTVSPSPVLPPGSHAGPGGVQSE